MNYDSTNEGWHEEYGMGGIYDDHDDFHDEDENEKDDDIDESMDGDFDSGMASAGHGTDEDYGYYGGDDDDYGYYGEDY